MNTEEMKAFERFNETCEDGEGYDVPKEMMKRLADIGVINHLSAGHYRITEFGLSILGYKDHPIFNIDEDTAYELAHDFGIFEGDRFGFARAILRKAQEK